MEVDLPELSSIVLGWNSFAFDMHSLESTLIMKRMIRGVLLRNRYGEAHSSRYKWSE